MNVTLINPCSLGADEGILIYCTTGLALCKLGQQKFLKPQIPNKSRLSSHFLRLTVSRPWTFSIIVISINLYHAKERDNFIHIVGIPLHVGITKHVPDDRRAWSGCDKQHKDIGNGVPLTLHTILQKGTEFTNKLSELSTRPELSKLYSKALWIIYDKNNTQAILLGRFKMHNRRN